MSEASERIRRRDLRRAVGVEAVSEIEQQGVALAHHAFVLNQHTQQLHEVQKRIDGLSEWLRADRRVGTIVPVLGYDIDTDTYPFRDAEARQAVRLAIGASFLARLRWLFLGR